MKKKKILIGVIALLAAWALIAYVILPRLWKRYEELHPAVGGAPTITHTGSGIPGDPVGRKEDLAFEQQEGGDPTRRHHVRFWRSEKTDKNGEPLWLGAATFDQRVEGSA
jgi:LssY C-terminus